MILNLFFHFLWSLRQSFNTFRDLSLESRNTQTQNCAPIQCTVWPRNEWYSFSSKKSGLHSKKWYLIQRKKLIYVLKMIFFQFRKRTNLCSKTDIRSVQKKQIYVSKMIIFQFRKKTDLCSKNDILSDQKKTDSFLKYDILSLQKKNIYVADDDWSCSECVLEVLLVLLSPSRPPHSPSLWRHQLQWRHSWDIQVPPLVQSFRGSYHGLRSVMHLWLNFF